MPEFEKTWWFLMPTLVVGAASVTLGSMPACGFTAPDFAQNGHRQPSDLPHRILGCPVRSGLIWVLDQSDTINFTFSMGDV